MIGEFSFKNFFSFKDQATLSMLSGSKREVEHLESNFFKIKDDKYRLLKSSAIYGPNASGKSTVLRAMFFLKMLILNSHKLNPTEPFNSMNIPAFMKLQPFLLDKSSRNEPTELSISFISEKDVLYKYSISLTTEKIISENLLAYFSNRPTTLIERGNNSIIFDSKYFKRAETLVQDIRENQLALSVCADKNITEALDIYGYFKKIHIFMDGITNDFDTFSMLDQDINGDFKKFLLKFLKKADFSIGDINHERSKIKFKDIPQPEREAMKRSMPSDIELSDESVVQKTNLTWLHNMYDGNTKTGLGALAIDYESIGTKLMFNIAGTVFNVMKKNMILFWDEFDRSLHSELTRNIIKTIHETDSRAQFILNTHDTSLLNIQELFRRDQIRFVEKNQYGESQLYSLLEFKEKKDKVVEKNYLKGRYGAKPSLMEEDLFA